MQAEHSQVITEAPKIFVEEPAFCVGCEGDPQTLTEFAPRLLSPRPDHGDAAHTTNQPAETRVGQFLEEAESSDH